MLQSVLFRLGPGWSVFVKDILFVLQAQEMQTLSSVRNSRIGPSQAHGDRATIRTRSILAGGQTGGHSIILFVNLLPTRGLQYKSHVHRIATENISTPLYIHTVNF